MFSILYEHGYKYALRVSTKNLVKLCSSDEFFVGRDKAWILGFLDGLEERFKDDKEIMEKVKALKKKYFGDPNGNSEKV
ncbi:MAG: hypothetical protein DRN30_04620 [Thermoplasmata archaeon]|nr:MAG: hypothetical protein DRN30_04620 [Thermoplasmata archaeon]